MIEQLPPRLTEPSEELQRLAKRYLDKHPALTSDRGELMSRWCEFLGRRAPEFLDLPIMHLVQAIVRASADHNQMSRSRTAETA